ncbi:MAG: hypothetical protein LBL58_16730 [Tannerellaceae bacterium]|nr:hypothetical protein [Tannerellaceae bacterium]
MQNKTLKEVLSGCFQPGISGEAGVQPLTGLVEEVEPLSIDMNARQGNN